MHSIKRSPVSRLLPLIAAASVLAFSCGGGFDAPGAPTEPGESTTTAPPNFVVVMTDDQAMDTMKAMPKTRRLIGAGGTRFTNALVSYPLCCPSRASFLSGQYAHNHGVLNNDPPNGGIESLDQRRTLPVWLSRAGYRTGFVGKYLNGYGKNRNGGNRFVPPGWSEWYSATAGDKKNPYDYRMSENGKLVRYGNRARDYKTDVMADKAERFIARRSRGNRPFFLWVATSAPHTDSGASDDGPRNPKPARRHFGSFADAKLPRPPSYNAADVSGKNHWVTNKRLIGPERKRLMRRLYVSQLESLLAVDDLVERLVERLERTGELERTILVFTSDNGFLRGQHRLDAGKSRHYDESVRVPLLIRGPGFPAGAEISTPVANVDLAATAVAAGDAEPHFALDGVPLQEVVAGRGGREGVLLEVFERKPELRAVRTERYVYADIADGEPELYDREQDPYELVNLADDPGHREVRERLAAHLDRLRECSGEDCR
jgi:N-acetylglucosamine-6-sulfatase